MSDQEGFKFDLGSIREAFANHQNGRFRIDRLVAQGGMGTVFAAFDNKFELPCAIKVINPDQIEKTEIVRRFLAEAKVMRRIRHPAIVQVYELDEVDGLSYIAFEWVGGGTLWDLLERYHGLPPDVAVKVLICVCGGLEHAHARSVIHRDVKPDNILLTTEGEPKITDFGIARIEGASARFTADGIGMGSPGYMAPEQFDRAKSVDVRADVHALGVTLWAALKGEDPPRTFIFSSTLPEHPEDLIDIPDTLAQVILRATAKNPDDRYPNVTAFRSDLEAMIGLLPVTSSVTFGQADAIAQGLARLPSVATIAPTPVDLSAVPTVIGVRPSLHTDAPRSVETSHDLRGELGSATQFGRELIRTRRRRYAYVAALAAGAAALAMAGVWLLQGGDQPPATAPSTAHATTVEPSVVPTEPTSQPIPTSVPHPVAVPDSKPIPPVSPSKSIPSPPAPAPGPVPFTRSETRVADGEVRHGQRLAIEQTVEPSNIGPSPVASIMPGKPPRIRTPKRTDRPERPGTTTHTGVKPPAPKPAPSPTAETPKEPTPTVEKISVRLSLPERDTAQVWLVGASGRHRVPGRVPPGTYKIVARFVGRPELVTFPRAVEVVSGSSPRLTCNSEYAKCRWH